MLFKKKTKSQKYIQKIIKNRYGYPAQIIPINNELGILIGTYVKSRSDEYAEYGIWLIRLDFLYISMGLSGFTQFTPRNEIIHEFQRILSKVNQSLMLLRTGDTYSIKRNYIASFLSTEIIKYNNREQTE